MAVPYPHRGKSVYDEYDIHVKRLVFYV